MTIKRLDEMVPMQNGRISQVRGLGALRQRMMDMGLVPGADIRVVRVAPLGDPVEYRVKGYHLSLRGREAQNILVDVDSVTLDQVQSGDPMKLVGIGGGKLLHKHLEDMGLQSGCILRVLKNQKPGPVRVEFNGLPVEIGRSTARKLLVEPVVDRETL